MKVTYIHHSSFLVELSGAAMLFDYYAGELPALPLGKPLLIFASHFHGDHFSPVIFELAKGREDVFFILSRDIKEKKVPEEYRERVRFVKPGEHFWLRLSEGGDVSEEKQERGASLAGSAALGIETFKSTDEGVAFWISCEGKELYFAGDLNNWWWEGEDPAWNRSMAASYKAEMEKMAGRTADAAFVPLDPRLEQWFYLGMKGFMDQVEAKAVFPMHFWKDYSVIQRMKAHEASEGWRDRIVEIRREGEEFLL